MPTASHEVKIRPAEQSGVEHTDTEQRFLDLTAQLLEATVELEITSIEDLASVRGLSLDDLFEKVNEAASKCHAKDGLAEDVIVPIEEIRRKNNSRAPGRLHGFFDTNYSVTPSDGGVYELSIYGID